LKTVWLLRHAKSSWDDESIPDERRPLNARGRRAAVLMGSWLEQVGARPDRLLCSAARRAQETLDGIRVAWSAEPAVRIEDDLYMASGGALLERLHGLDAGADSVLLIGHNPGMHDLAVGLAGRGGADDLHELGAAYPTAGCCEIAFDVDDWSELARGRGELRRFAVPKGLV